MQRTTPAQVADFKGRSKCPLCGKYGHFMSEHSPDGRLNPGVSCNATPIFGYNKIHAPQKKNVTFNMPNIMHEFGIFHEDFYGPILDESASYSDMGINELKVLLPILLLYWTGNFGGIP